MSFYITSSSLVNFTLRVSSIGLSSNVVKFLNKKLIKLQDEISNNGMKAIIINTIISEYNKMNDEDLKQACFKLYTEEN